MAEPSITASRQAKIAVTTKTGTMSVESTDVGAIHITNAAAPEIAISHPTVFRFGEAPVRGLIVLSLSIFVLFVSSFSDLEPGKGLCEHGIHLALNLWELVRQGISQALERGSGILLNQAHLRRRQLRTPPLR
jgi:hypothetical protein